MANVLAEVDAVGVLSSPVLPVAVGGGSNPFFELQSFLTSTQGNWQGQTAIVGGLYKIQSLASKAGGLMPTGGETYISPGFPSTRLTTANLTEAFVLFDAISLYFEVVGLAYFVQLPDADYDNNVPSYLPNSTRPVDPDDPESPTEPVTWRQWKDATHEHLEEGGSVYIPTCSNNNSSYIAGSICVDLIDEGYDVKEMSDWPQSDPDPATP